VAWPPGLGKRRQHALPTHLHQHSQSSSRS
jgi:hypothetical protein